MGSLSFFVWNVHGADGFKNYQMPDFVVEKILIEEKDIVIITEFVRTSKWSSISRKLASKYWRYTYHVKSCINNEILILIRKEFEDININENMNMLKTTMLPLNQDNPNFLQIQFKLSNEKTLYIIGTRIRDCDHRPQFQILNNYFATLPDDAYIICGGDFNEWKNPIQQKIQNLTVHTPTYQMQPNDFSTLSTWSAVPKDKNGNCGKALLDHMICSNNFSCVDLKDYIWDFINTDNGYKERLTKDYKSDLIHLPDHGILIGKVKYT